MPPKMAEDVRSETLWQFQVQSDKQAMVTQSNIVVMENWEKRTVEKMWQSHVREKGEKGEYISAVGIKSHQ